MKNILFFLLLTATMFACNSQPKVTENSEVKVLNNIVNLSDIQFKNAGITIGNIVEKRISSVVSVNGIIDVPPQNMVSISVPLGGYLKSTKLLPGTHINKGEVIAVMEDQQYIQLQQDYLTTKANFQFIENDYLRQQELSKEQAASDKTYRQALANFESQKIMLKSFAEKLKLIGINANQLTANSLSKSIKIKSPIDGYVSAVNVNIGKYVAPTDVLFELVNPTDIHLNLAIFEQDLDKIKLGQKLYAYTNSNPNKKYLCEIILIGKNLSSSRNVEVHCHFEQYDQTLIPGMFMNAEIEATSTQEPALPENAIVSYENKQYIFIAKEAKIFEMIEIKKGKSENGFTQIISPKKADLSDKKIVMTGAYSLLMMLKNTSEE